MFPLRKRKGLARSLRIYRMNAVHARGMDALYSRFVSAGDLVFDLGAHVGDRTASFRRLGARVIAIEPQAALVATLRVLHARDPNVQILPLACGDAEGVAEMRLNSDNPTVSTLSSEFVRAATDAVGWSDQVWDGAVPVRTTTLDALIDRFGEPAFVKIDVEGYEDKVLAGLSRPLRPLSFEFTTLQREVASRALARLESLGPHRFNFALGETQRLVWPEGVGLLEIQAYLDALPAEANSGDVYAFLLADGA